jgi:hypothetical protein
VVFMYVSRPVKRRTLFKRTHQDSVGYHNVFVTGENCWLWWSTEMYCLLLSCCEGKLGAPGGSARTLRLGVQNDEYLWRCVFQPKGIHSITNWRNINHGLMMFKALRRKEASYTAVVIR